MQGRITELVRDRSDAELDTIAPAAPEWRVRDVVAHLSGVCADVVGGNVRGVGTDEWTAAQVDARRDWSMDRLLTEWDELGAQVAGVVEAFPDLPDWNRWIVDAVTHEHDVRGALGAPGARDSLAVTIAVEWGIEMVGQRLEREGSGTLRVELEGADPRTVGAGDPTATVRAPAFELLRAMAGRRSGPQMLAYVTAGDLRPETLLLAFFPAPRRTDLVE